MKSIDFSDPGNFRVLPLIVDGESLKFPGPEKSTLKKSGLKIPNLDVDPVKRSEI